MKIRIVNLIDVLIVLCVVLLLFKIMLDLLIFNLYFLGENMNIYNVNAIKM